MSQNLDDIVNFSNFISYYFVKLQEYSTSLNHEIEVKFGNVQDAFLKKKFNLSFGQLSEYNKQITLEIKRFHDLFVLLVNITLKNEDKCLQIQEGLKSVNNPSLQKEFETLGNAFGNQVSSKQKLIESIIAQTVDFNDIDFLNNLKKLNNDKELLQFMSEKNLELKQSLTHYTKLLNDFEEYIHKTAQYEIKIQEMYNQIFAKR